MAFRMLNKGHDHREGVLTKKIEDQTARIPSSAFLAVALGAMTLSAGLELFGKRRELATFIGLWTPTILIMGLYNKLVKVAGND